MRFHILGVGSIGSLLAHSIRRTLNNVHDVSLIHPTVSQALVAAEKYNTIQVATNWIKTNAHGFRSEALPLLENDPAHNLRGHHQKIVKRHIKHDHIDSLFVCTKAHPVLDGLKRLLPRISPNTTIVLLQNGMGILEELFVELFQNPTERPHFILTSNTHGAYAKSYMEVSHTGVGTLEFGIVPGSTTRDYEAAFKVAAGTEIPGDQGDLDDITTQDDPQFDRFRSLRNTVAALLSLEPLQTSWKPIGQIELAMRRKLVVNSVINPLTALMNCRNGDLFDAPGRSEERRVGKECRN